MNRDALGTVLLILGFLMPPFLILALVVFLPSVRESARLHRERAATTHHRDAREAAEARDEVVFDFQQVTVGSPNREEQGKPSDVGNDGPPEVEVLKCPIHSKQGGWLAVSGGEVVTPCLYCEGKKA